MIASIIYNSRMHPMEVVYSKNEIEASNKISEQSLSDDKLVLNFQMKKGYRIPDTFNLADAASQLYMTTSEYHERHIRKNGVKLS